MNNLAKLAEQQKNQRVIESRNSISKQTQDKNLAEYFETKTKITKAEYKTSN